MLTSKEKRYLKSIAMTKPITEHIGKEGITKVVLDQIDNALRANELVKIKVLPNSLLEAKQIIESLATALNAEMVEAIGRVVVLYRYSNKEKIKHLLDGIK